MKNILLVIILSFLVSSFSTAQTLQKIEQWDRFELPLQYKYNGNSFTDIRLSALFQNKDTAIVVPGFFDSDNIFRIR